MKMKYYCFIFLACIFLNSCSKLFPDYRDDYVGTYNCHSTYNGLVYDSSGTHAGFNVFPRDYRMTVEESAVHGKIIFRDGQSSYEVTLDKNGGFTSVTDPRSGNDGGYYGNFIDRNIFTLSIKFGGLASGVTNITGRRE